MTLRAAIWALALIAALVPAAAFANSAEMTMLPTRVVLDDNQRWATVIVKNTGDATGDFRVDLGDRKMRDDGAVVRYSAGETPQYSASPLVHAAPASMTLKPGQTQEIHIIMHAPGKPMEPGEYRTHLQVHLTHPNVDQPTAGPHEGVVVHAEIVLSIPILVRLGAPSLSMSIDQQKLTHDPKGTPVVEFNLVRNGNISSMGDFSVTCAAGNAPARVIKSMPGQAVYRPLPQRHVSLPLDETPAGISLSTCRLTVIYAEQKDAGGKVLAQAPISP